MTRVDVRPPDRPGESNPQRYTAHSGQADRFPRWLRHRRPRWSVRSVRRSALHAVGLPVAALPGPQHRATNRIDVGGRCHPRCCRNPPMAGRSSPNVAAGPSSMLPDDLSGRSVLDVGCGSGTVARELVRRGAARVVAVDIDDVRFADARAHNTLPEHGRIEFRFADLEVALPKGPFDHVVCHDLLHRVRNPIEVLAELDIGHVDEDGRFLVRGRRRHVGHLVVVSGPTGGPPCLRLLSTARRRGAGRPGLDTASATVRRICDTARPRRAPGAAASRGPRSLR